MNATGKVALLLLTKRRRSTCGAPLPACWEPSSSSVKQVSVNTVEITEIATASLLSHVRVIARGLTFDFSHSGCKINLRNRIPKRCSKEKYAPELSHLLPFGHVFVHRSHAEGIKLPREQPIGANLEMVTWCTVCPEPKH